MQNTIKKVLYTLLFIYIIFPIVSFASEDCPYGRIDDAYPGDCGRYIDVDKNDMCDHSQLALVSKEAIDAKDKVNGEAREGDLDQDSKQILNAEVSENKSGPTYHLIPIAAVLTILYIFSYTLSKKKIISVLKHRKFWNLLLLISFLISGLLGILLIIKINFGLSGSLPFNALFWHVEIGIAMFMITLFHMSWHLSYFKNILKFK